jgi:hypothetical protein
MEQKDFRQLLASNVDLLVKRQIETIEQNLRKAVTKGWHGVEFPKDDILPRVAEHFDKRGFILYSKYSPKKTKTLTLQPGIKPDGFLPTSPMEITFPEEFNADHFVKMAIVSQINIICKEIKNMCEKGATSATHSVIKFHPGVVDFFREEGFYVAPKTVTMFAPLPLTKKREVSEDEDVVEGDDPTLICAICLAKRRRCLVQPCNHFCLCMSCSSNVEQCPLCRCDIDDVVRVFM